MATRAVFPTVRPAAGMYESFYLRAVSPQEPVAVWIRYTVHKRAGAPPRGSLWFTLFDSRSGAPFQHKLTTTDLRAPGDAWIAISEAELGPGRAQGACGEASWSLRFESREPALRHLTPEWLYRAPLPRTKLESPAPLALFDGVVAIAGRPQVELSGWPGMVGHNWGAEHAERWIWLSGAAFEGRPQAWLDVALGRLRLAGRLTPWVANGAVCIDGRRHRLGGLAARGAEVRESASGCSLRLQGARGLTLDGSVEVPPGSAAGWRYADPDGGEHDVVNCSIASLDLGLTLPGESARTALRSAHGGAYELGMRERDHGVPIAPFPDG
jgi:hypothetical protein